MNLSPLTALSPLDGRYHDKVSPLSEYFSEFALFRFRVMVELEWLKALSLEPALKDIPRFSPASLARLDRLITHFSQRDAQTIKAIEAKINHDVKAIEYWLKKRLSGNTRVARACEFIHFACTSEDINNLCHGLALKRSREAVLLPALDGLTRKLAAMAHQYAALPMLARTHGQPASPTTLGKELANFSFRLRRQISHFSSLRIMGKMNGAVGNYNAHTFAYPEIAWEKFCARFVSSLGLSVNPYTTQIEPHDSMAEYLHNLARINTILIGLCRDLWGYVSLGYFRQKTARAEVGSSTMPHKVNPIDFENAEGNFGLANALLGHMGAKLPISRWQRDLSDSTVLRNLGVALGYSLLGYQSCLKGLSKLDVDAKKLGEDLEFNWEVLAEAIQTIMRRHRLPQPYEQLKALTRGKRISRESLQAFISTLKLPLREKARLLKLKPQNYLGLAEKLAKRV
jgi:adenylosuccinate lyase